MRVLVVHAEPAIQAGLSMRLAIEPDLAVVGVASGCEQALELIATTDPDIVLLDAKCARPEGAAILQGIRQRLPELRLVMLTPQSDPDTRRKARAAGADALVETCAGDAALIQAIRGESPRHEND